MLIIFSLLLLILNTKLLNGQWLSFGSFLSTNEVFTFNNNATASVSSGEFIEI